MNSNMETKTKNGSLWNRFVSLFRPRDRQLIKEEMRKEEIRQLIIEVLDADWCHGIADAIYSANHGEIASDIREMIDTYDIAQEFDTYDIGQEITEDVSYNLDVSDVAQHLDISEIVRQAALEDTVDNAVENHLHQIDFSELCGDRLSMMVGEISVSLVDDVIAEVVDRVTIND
jgi:hypothetical protein